MKQFLRKTFLTLLGGIFLSSGAWADGEVAFTTGNMIGDENNSGGWFYGISEVINIPANKTLTLKFKTYSATDAQLVGKGDGGANLPWGAAMSHVIRIGNGGDDLYWRADGYGWKGSANTNDNSSNWFKFLGANTRWGISGTDAGVTYDGQWFREDVTGSDVVVTITRVGAELRITQDISATSGKYRRYFVLDYGTADDNIWAQMVVERAHIVVSENYAVTDTEVPQISGQLIGSENETTGFWTTWSGYYTVAPNKSLTLKYKNYSNRINNYNGPVAYVTTDADRAASGYTEYFGLRPDNWVNIANVNATTTNFDQISWNWATFREKIDGATVTLTVTRSGANVTIREEFAPVDGSTTLYEEYTKACDDGNQNIRVFLAVEGAFLDLLSSSEAVYTTIGSKGWSTFSNADYALNFSGIAGLTAYQITDQNTKVITKSAVTSVPANTGLLLNGTAGTTYTIPVVASASALSSNKLVAGNGSAISMTSGHTYYVLTYEDGDAQFKKLTSAVAIPAGKAYLHFPSAIEARSLDVDGDGTTGIQNLKVGKEDNVYYDLQGRHVLYPKKGLYIVNGKKVIMK